MKSFKTIFSTLLLAGTSALAGTFTANFATQDTSQFIYNATGTLADGVTPWMPLIENNKFQLTTNQNGLMASFSPNDFDASANVEALTANFKLQFGPGSGNAADGLAFSFGPGVDQYATGYGEVGASSGACAVSFHTYTSNGGPAVDVYLQGTRIAHYPMAKTDMVNSTLQDVSITLKRNSTLSVSYRGQSIFTNLYLAGWGYAPMFYNISAKTGGENEETDIANLSIKTTLYGNPVAPTFTASPTNITVAEGASATFKLAVDGNGPFEILWYQDGNRIDNAADPVMTLPVVHYADNGSQIAAMVVGPGGTISSKAATLTVIRDVTVPTALSATADKSFTALLVKYSKPVSDTALVAANYALDQGITVSSVKRIDAQTVQLTTSKLAEGTGYNVTINGVQDTATLPNTIAANTKLHFQTFQFMNGTVVHQKYTGFDDNAGSNPDNLFADSRFPNQPSRRDLLTAFEYPANGAWFNSPADADKLFFDTMEGFFTPPTDGDYVFFISFSDRGWLYLSPDEDPANKVMIAGTTGWSDPRSWLTSHDYNTDLARSDKATSSKWPTGGTITLQAGKKYYMMMVHHMPDWAGGSWCDATYKMAADADPANGTPSILLGTVLGSYIDPTGTSVTFTQQPKNTSGLLGQSARFTAAATGVSPYGAAINYQWQSAPAGSSVWTDILGATTGSLNTPLLTLDDNGRQYRLAATVPPVTQYSSVATLSVTADTTAPVVSVGAMASATAGTITVGVGFDETVDDATGGDVSNYSVSSGTITSIDWYTNRFTADSLNPLVMFRKQNALLTITGFSGTTGTLTVRNVKDVYNNAITSTNVSFTVDTKRKWGVVGANEFGGFNAVVPVAANGWDVYSDGMTEWANYDETTFIYEAITGDFDKKVRVQYQDGASTWARAGLIARDVLNLGVDRATQATVAGRYQKVHVNPVGAELTGPGNAGNGVWEGNRRLNTGGNSDSALQTNNSTPLYPNAWCRLKRSGQTFTIFRSDDGTNWLAMGSTTWGLDAPTLMPATVYVGPEYTPENGNVSLIPDRGTFLAQFRDYGDYVAIFNPALQIAKTGTKVTVTWGSGTLMSCSTLKGTYTAVSGATSPYVVTPGSTPMFYQVKQ